MCLGSHKSNSLLCFGSETRSGFNIMKFKTSIILIFFLFIIPFRVYSQSGWVRQSPLPNPKASFSIKFIDNYTGISVGMNGLMIKTTNGGVSWRDINSNTTKWLRKLIFINSTTGFAVGDSSIIIKTTNAGENWSISLNSNSKYAIKCIYFINAMTGYAYRDSNDVIYKTTDCGNNWEYINTDLIQKFTSNSFSYITESIYFLNENTGFYCDVHIFKTINGGINWIPIDTINYNYFHLHFFDQLTGLSFGVNGNISKTIDGGNNWSFLTQVPSMYLTDINFIDSLNGYLFGQGDYGIDYKTTDKGNSWIPLYGSSYGLNLAFNFVDINTGYNAGVGKFIKTTNGGINWNIISSGSNQWLFNIHFFNSDFGCTVGENEILKTTNGGNQWLSLSGRFYNDQFISVHCYDTNSIVAASWSYIQKTTNGGLNWLLKDHIIAGNLETAYFINNVGYYFSGNIMGKSTDYGENWSHTNTIIPIVGSLFFINENTGYAGTPIFNIYKTIDGGMNWSLIYNEPFQFLCQNIYFVDSLNGFAIGDGYFFKTTNGGINWNQFSTPASFNLKSLWMINVNTGYITTNFGYIYKTTNSGNNWILLNSGTNQNLNYIYFMNNNTGYVVGDQGIILKTTDGGGNVWINQNFEQIPNEYYLFQNYPNPFNPTTTIKYALPKNEFVKLVIFDILGREIQTLVNEKQSAGTYETIFNASQYPSGVYFYKLTTDGFSETKKMLMIK